MANGITEKGIKQGPPVLLHRLHSEYQIWWDIEDDKMVTRSFLDEDSE